MKVYVSDLVALDWLNKCLPDLFRMLKDDIFLFTYSYNEDKGGLDIEHMQYVKYIQPTTYKILAQHQAEHLGFLQQPFESDSTLLYNLLYTFIKDGYDGDDLEINLKRLNKLFVGYKQQDYENIKNMPVPEQNGLYEITSHADVETALKKYIYSPKYISGLSTITSLFDTYYRNRFGESFYYNCLYQIIQAIKNPSGGFIPQENGTMRYMIIGENAFLEKEERESLEKAKRMFRNGLGKSDEALKKIWYETGWFLNIHDGRWRKKISDDKFKLIEKSLTNVNGDVLYYPENCPVKIESVYLAGENDEVRSKALVNGYNGIIADVVDHPLLFKYYPEIKTLPLFYKMIERFVSQQDAQKRVKYFFDPTNEVLVMNGIKMRLNDYRILLHEMQHYIQDKENFATGGNTFLSELLNNVGAADVKMFFANMAQVEKIFVDNAVNTDYKKIRDKFSYWAKHIAKKEFADNMLKNSKDDVVNHINSFAVDLENKQKYISSAGDIARTIMSFYSSDFYKLAPELKQDVVNFITIDLQLSSAIPFMDENRRIQQQNIAEKESMNKRGWSAFDLQQLSINVYKGLYGELESRDVQQSSNVPSEFADYFTPYSSETIQNEYLNVMYNEGMPPTKTDYKAGLETAMISQSMGAEFEQKYIIHLMETNNPAYYLHELGHIAWDFAKDLEITADVTNGYLTESLGFDTVEHYFIHYWFGWLISLNFDDIVTTRLKEENYAKDSKFNHIFNQIFVHEATKIDVVLLGDAIRYMEAFNNSIDEKDFEPKIKRQRMR